MKTNKQTKKLVAELKSILELKTEVLGYFFYSFHYDTREIDLGTANKHQKIFPVFGITKCAFVIRKAYTVGLSGFDIPFHFSAGSEI